MILKGLSLTVWKEQISFTIISIDMDKMSTRLNWKIKHSKVNLLSPVIKIKNLLSNRKGGCRRRAIFSNLSLSFSEKTLLCTLGLLKRTNKSVFERKWNFVCSSNIRADGCKRRLSKDSSHIKQNTATFYLWNR